MRDLNKNELAAVSAAGYEAACRAGVMGGAALGGLGGAAAGSAVPAIGTAAGGFVGASAGAAQAFASLAGDGGVCNFTSTGSGGSSGSRVICTHFYRKGMLDQAIWRADMAFTFKNLSPATVRGYQFWAIPYVRLMRKSTMAEKFMYPLAKWRAQELAYQMGVVSKGSWRGKLVRLTCEPICWALGVLVGEQNWQSLYEPAK